MQTQIYVDRALNSEVWDIEGNRYIDFAAGIAVVNTGHCHPKIMAAVAEARRLGLRPPRFAPVSGRQAS